MNDVRACVLGNGKCRQHAAPGHRACTHHAAQLAATLTILAKTYYELTTIAELTPTGSGDNSGGSRAVPGPRSPAVDALIVHTDPRSVTEPGRSPAALASIAGWAREVREERSLDTTPDQMIATVPAGRITMAREVTTLRRNWDWILGQPWLEGFAEEIHGVLNALRIVRRMDAPVLRIGTCPTKVALIPVRTNIGVIDIPLLCGAPLRVRADATTIRCRNCDTTWSRDRWHELGDGLTDYARLADELGVKAGTLRYWASVDGWTEHHVNGRKVILRAEALDSYRKRRGPTPLDQTG